MNFLKKKKKADVERTTQFSPISMTLTPEQLLDGFSEESIREAYEIYQIRYKESQETIIQQILMTLSKIMTDRAYLQGNGEVKKFFLKKYNLSEEDWEGYSREQKQKMAEMKEKMEVADKEFQNIAKPQPEKIEISLTQDIVNVEEPKNMNDLVEKTFDDIQNDDLKKIERQQLEQKVRAEIEERVKAEYLEEQNEQKILIDGIEVDKQSIQRLEKELAEKQAKKDQKYSTLQEDEIFQQPKKKKGLGSLFKKKIPKQQTRPSSVEQIIKSGVTEEQKERAVKMEQATVKKHSAESILKKVFVKPDKEKKPKLSLPDVYCPDCTHPLKAHQSKGVSVGCKCGCLNTIEVIAEKHGVQLFSPKEVLDKISKENPEPEFAEMPNLTNSSLPDDSVLEQQAKALQSLKPKTIEPGDTLTSKKGTAPVYKKKVSEQEPLHEGMCANCDHIPKSHFDNTGFCTVIGCKCEDFRSYPQ